MGLMLTAGSTSICIDYYATDDPDRLTKPPIPAGELTGIDAFLGTHDHIDHMDHKAWRIWAETMPQARFVFPRMHMEAVLADGIDPSRTAGLNDGEAVRIGDFTIHAIAASHEFLDMDPETGLYPNLQYIVEAGGVRIHHAGDTVRYEGMLSKLTALGDIDMQLLPINGRDARRYRSGCIGNMTFQEAADLAGDVGTALVMPGHWDMFEGNTADPSEFADYIDAKYEGRLKCRIPVIMEKILISKKL